MFFIIFVGLHLNHRLNNFLHKYFILVNDIRPFIVICFVKNLNLGQENLR